MPVAYLNEGSVSLAAANWSDGIGFANSAMLVIERGGQAIVSGLDQSALTVGIEYLDIRPEFTGSIGSGAASLQCDIDASSSSFLRYAAKSGSLFYRAQGNNSLCQRYVQTGSGVATLTGGTVSRIEIASGRLIVNLSTVVTTLYVVGGDVDIQPNATAITNVHVLGGVVRLSRQATNLYVSGGVCLYDGQASVTTFEQRGDSVVRWISGDCATARVHSGRLSFRDLRRDASFGSSAFETTPQTVIQRTPASGVALTFGSETRIAGGAGTAGVVLDL